MKRLEYVLMAQEGEGKEEDTSSTNNTISDILIGIGDEQNDMLAVTQTQQKQENDGNVETVELNTDHSSNSTSKKKKKKKKKKSKTSTVRHLSEQP